MKTKGGTLFFLILSCLAGAGAAQAQSTPQQIVDQHFPASLLAGPDSANLDKVSCFVVFDTLSSGAPRTIIAAYSNDFEGTVQVLQVQSDGTFQVIDEPAGFSFGGTRCTIDLADVDGDGINEIRVSFGSFRPPTSDWIFKWDGSHLHNIGPTSQPRRGKQHSLLCSTDFVNLFQDGTLQIVSVSSSPSPDDGSIETPNFLYRLSGGVFVLSSPVAYVRTFTRQKGAPAPVSDSFDLFTGSTGPYVVRISNGDARGNNRVSSADVAINSAEIFGPSSFNQQVGTLSAPLNSLNARGNTVQVDLKSSPGSQITMVVEDHSAAFANGPQ